HTIYQSLYFHSFFFNNPTTTKIYTLSLHDALPISKSTIDLSAAKRQDFVLKPAKEFFPQLPGDVMLASLPGDTPDDFRMKTQVRDRKSTRLNSSHVAISYAVFCLKKKKNTEQVR